MTAAQGVRIPSYRLQKARGSAVVTIDGKDHYLGPHDSPESREKYHRLIHEWLAGKTAESPAAVDDPGPTINELVLYYWDRHVVAYYVKDGKPTSEQDNIRQAFRFVRRLYEHSPSKEFGPLALKAVRSAMILSGRCRNLINKDIHRVRRMFKWAASEQILPVSVYQALETVEALSKGRSQARETAPVKPVPIEVVNDTLPFLSPVVRAMVQLQLLSGARPGEICSLRPMDLDRSDPSCWSYTPSSHKTEHHGKARTIYLGPKAQSVLVPFLERPSDAFAFQPREAEQQRNSLKRAERKSKLTPSQRRRNGDTSRSGRTGERYTKDSYGRAIQRACDRAFLHTVLSVIPAKTLSPEQAAELKSWRKSHRWHPHQLRHTSATAIRKRFGIEAAKTVLGHGNLKTTEIYAEKDTAAAMAIMGQVG